MPPSCTWLRVDTAGWLRHMFVVGYNATDRGLADVLEALRRGFGAIRIVAVHGRLQEPAIRILVQAVKGSRAPLQIGAPLALNGDDGCPTALARAVLAGEQILPAPSIFP